MHTFHYYLLIVLCFSAQIKAQDLQDDFEGNGNIAGWIGDGCIVNPTFTNIFQTGINTSATVLRYFDNGGQYANVTVNAGSNFNLSVNNTFTFKIYVPSSGLTGSQPNQVSLKLQDGNLPQPWSTQAEVIKPIVLNTWQTVTISFETDPFINFDVTSSPPIQRTDFNRVLFQINGENNGDNVVAYIDDFLYSNPIVIIPSIFNQLVWSDEFDTDGAVDNSKWHHQTLFPTPGSWYNGEIQHYTNRLANSYIDSGTLKVVAKKEVFTDQGYTKQYTSARLNSKFAFKYGRVEFRAKLPVGIGTWPAIWTLGKNINENGAYWDNQGFGTVYWPACGEIDIMEQWGSNPNYTTSATHTPSSSGNTVNVGGQTINTLSTAFHVYALEWTANKIECSVDNVVHLTYNPTIIDSNYWPFNLEQYLIINVAMQSNVPATFTQTDLEVDYIRIYQESTVNNKEQLTINGNRSFPNPVIDEITITTAETKQEYVSVQIIGLDTKLQKTEICQISNNKVNFRNLSSLKKGMYFINYQVNNQNYSSKFIKE
jgi:beta-glucanase (GH16 family)